MLTLIELLLAGDLQRVSTIPKCSQSIAWHREYHSSVTPPFPSDQNDAGRTANQSPDAGEINWWNSTLVGLMLSARKQTSTLCLNMQPWWIGWHLESSGWTAILWQSFTLLTLSLNYNMSNARCRTGEEEKARRGWIRKSWLLDFIRPGYWRRPLDRPIEGKERHDSPLGQNCFQIEANKFCPLAPQHFQF